MNLSPFLSMSRKELLVTMKEAYSLSPESIANSSYQGISLGLPHWVDRLAWKTFVKSFCFDETTGVVRGWNVRLEQTGIEGEIRPQMKKGVARTFGHFRVVSSDGYRFPHPCAPGAVIDYSHAGNAYFDPIQLARDPLVSLQSDNTDWLLGWSYLDLNWFRLSTPSFFLLRRIGKLEEVVYPPRYGR